MKKFFDKKKTYIILFLLFFVLCYLFPFSHDDWAWGASYGIERLKTNFDAYNGRWAGNLLVLLLTRSNLIKTIVMSFSLTVITYFINEITNSKNKNSLFLIILLMVSVPYLILRQAIVWTAGFSNYVASMVFILWFIYLNKKIFTKEEVYPLWKTIVFFFIGFISALFVEHVTLYLLVLSLGSIIYYFIKNKKLNISLLLYFIGAILGTILMFSNSAYSNIQSGADEYRTMETGNFITNSINSFFNTIYKELVFNNYFLNVILSSLVILVLYRYLKKNKKFNKLINILMIVLVSFPLYSLITKFTGINLFLKYTKYINGLFSIIYCLTILISAFFISNKTRKERAIFYLLSIVILTGPLFVVTPIGSRCFYPMYLFWILTTLEFFNDLVKEEIKLLNNIFIVCALVFFSYLFLVYGYIFKIYNERIKYINDNKNEEVLVLPKLPYEKYVWCGNPINDEFTLRFKDYYKIDESKEIEFITLKEWNKRDK